MHGHEPITSVHYMVASSREISQFSIPNTIQNFGFHGQLHPEYVMSFYFSTSIILIFTYNRAVELISNLFIKVTHFCLILLIAS
jgi:hypothetical protein